MAARAVNDFFKHMQIRPVFESHRFNAAHAITGEFCPAGKEAA